MGFWDWKSGYQFQRLDSLVQPGSLDSEAGIFCATFDKTGLRLITGEADKTIKIWKEDDEATPETHPLDWKPSLMRKRTTRGGRTKRLPSSITDTVPSGQARTSC